MTHRPLPPVLPIVATAMALLALPVGAAPAPAPAPAATSTQIGQDMNLVLGKSTLMRLPHPIERISVGNPTVADVTLISPQELYLLGKTIGSTNVILWRRGGAATIIDVVVGVDAGRLQGRIGDLLPDEKNIRVVSAAEGVVLSGVVSSSEKADHAVSIAESYMSTLARGMAMPMTAGDVATAPGTKITVSDSRSSNKGGPRVINMLRVSAPQQVMLEVKVAEVSKTLLDKLGAAFGGSRTNGSWTYSILSNLMTDSSGLFSAIKNPRNFAQLDFEKKDGLVKILAEPNIVAVSGQEGSFLAGGKIFIPVARANSATGLATITLEEKEFGVGLKFTPTVLEGGRINLKVAPEVSELSQTGSPFTTVDGVTAVLPSFTVRRAQTTVQLNDGQSFAIAGLIKNNVTETMKRLPVLGEVPVLGALFRSNEFQTDQSELMFVITPRLVKPLPPDHALPTDHFVPPSRAEFFLGGAMEGSPKEPVAPAPVKEPAATPAKGGFDVR